MDKELEPLMFVVVMADVIPRESDTPLLVVKGQVQWPWSIPGYRTLRVVKSEFFQQFLASKCNFKKAFDLLK